MVVQIFKVIGTGVLGGVFLFAIPFFFFKVLFFFLFIGLLSRMFGWRRRRMWMRRYDQYYYDAPYEGKEGVRDHSQQNPKSV